jgi:uncharacterized protein (TIGR02246 family)
MRPVALALAFVLLVVTVPASGQATAPPASSAALDAWVAAFNSRDPKRIVALYAPDAVFWGTTARTVAQTPDEIWAYFKDAGQRPQIRVRIESRHVRELGDVAVMAGAYRFFDLEAGAERNVRPARYTFVFRRAGDTWQIVEHHSSRVPEP